MEDLFWSMTQESRVLQELRKEIGGIWNDDAARELTGRYLDPHENEDRRMLTGLNKQKNALDESDAKLVSAETQSRYAEEYGLLVAESLKATQQDVQSAYGNFDLYARYNSDASSKFPVVKNLLSQANNACNA